VGGNVKIVNIAPSARFESWLLSAIFCDGCGFDNGKNQFKIKNLSVQSSMLVVCTSAEVCFSEV
jgi:hypothetical protein